MTATAHALLAPRANANDETVILRRWVLPAATWVDVGTVVAEVETSKTIVVIQSDAPGYLQYGTREGDEIAVGRPLGWLTAGPGDVAPASNGVVSASAGGSERLISDGAATLLEEYGLAPADIPGRAPIRRSDVEAAFAARANGAPVDWRAAIAALPNGSDAVLIFGADVQGAVVADCLETSAPGTAVAFVDDAPKRSHLAGLPIFPATAIVAIRERGIGRAHISIAAPKAKLAVAQRLTDAGYELVSVRHATAVVASSATIGRGAFLGPLTIVGANASIADFAQINNGAIVAHDAVVERAARLSDGVLLAGSVIVGEGAFLGLGVTVNEKITIGAGSTVVSGVSVFDHVPPACIVRTDGKAYPLR